MFHKTHLNNLFVDHLVISHQYQENHMFFSRERHSSLTKLVTRASLYAFSNMFLTYRKSVPLWCYPPLKKNHSFYVPAHFLGYALLYSFPSFNAKFQCVLVLSSIFPYLFFLWFVLVHPFPRPTFNQHVTLTLNFLLTEKFDLNTFGLELQWATLWVLKTNFSPHPYETTPSP